MLRPARMVSVCLTTGILCATGCKPSEQSASATPGRDARTADRPRPNIVLITVCTLRYDRLGSAGYHRDTTPFLDALAAKGTFFEQMFSSSSWTKASVASILTGLTPNVHRMTDFYRDTEIRSTTFAPKRILADEILSIAECLKEAGYATACQINNIHAGAFFNMTQGFDDVGAHDFMVDTAAMATRFSQWLHQLDKSQPFFLFMLTRDPHITYNPRYEYYLKYNRSPRPVPREKYRGYPFALRDEVLKLVRQKQSVSEDLQIKWNDLYDAELAQLDASLSRIPSILQKAGRDSNTIIILTADHGERFFEHGRVGHRGPLDEEVLHVPFIVVGPGIPAGRRIKKVVRSIDLYPTVASLANAKVPDVVQGIDLLPLIRGEDTEFHKLTAFSSFESPTIIRHAVRDERFKLRALSDGTRSLYDLANDPGELRDIFGTEQIIAEHMDEVLNRWLEQEEALREVVARGQTRTLTPEVLEQLRALSYIK